MPPFFMIVVVFLFHACHTFLYGKEEIYTGSNHSYSK